MREFRIRIKEDAFDALVHLAIGERQDPREQAALLVENALQPIVEKRGASNPPRHLTGPAHAGEAA
jgi:hypothetical protein